MTRLSTTIFYIYAAVCIFIVLGSLLGYITFGYGLGDGLYIVFTLSFLIGACILKAFIDRNSDETLHIVFAILMIAIMIFLILKITLLRGVEYRWNGKLFYDVST